MRMERSLELMEKRDMNMDEIARAVGYQGVSNFYRAFRERFGGTPCSVAAMMRGK